MASSLLILVCAFLTVGRGMSLAFCGFSFGTQCDLCGQVKRVVCVTVLFLLFLTPVYVDGRTCNQIGAIQPRDGFFLTGENIILTCTLNKPPARKHYKIMFQAGRNSSFVDEKYITRINSTQIKMVLPPVQAANIKVQGTQFKCVVFKPNNNITSCKDMSIVRLDYYPEVKNLMCRIFNMETMLCTWDLVHEYKHPSSLDIKCSFKENQLPITMVYTAGVSQNGHAPCPNLTNVSCYWNKDQFSRSQQYFFKIRVTHKDVKDASANLTQNVFAFDIVIPNSVSKLRAVPDATRKRCMTVDWQKPKGFVYNMTFKLTYYSIYHNITLDLLHVTVKNEVTVCELKPFTWYTWSVRGRLVDFDGRPRGFWSNESRITSLTASDAPDVNPMTESLQFERHDKNEASLYWQPLKKEDLHSDEHKTGYNISYGNQHDVKPARSFVSDLKIPANSSVLVSIQTYNDKGHAQGSSHITLFPPYEAPSPSELIIEYEDSSKCKSTYATVRPEVEDVKRFAAISHVLVWCEGRSSCQKPLKTANLAGQLKFKFPSDHCTGNYRYGLVTNGQPREIDDTLYSTGIHWANCEYQLGKVPSESLQVRLASVQPVGGVQVTWTGYTCGDNAGYITAYQLAYCLKKGTEEGCQCQRQFTANISRTAESYTLTDLEADKKVCVWVRGVSQAGPGPFNAQPMVHVVTAESWNYEGLIVVVAVIGALALLSVIVFIGRKIYVRVQKYVRSAQHINLPIHRQDQDSIHYTDNVETDIPIGNNVYEPLLPVLPEETDGSQQQDPPPVGYHRQIGYSSTQPIILTTFCDSEASAAASELSSGPTRTVSGEAETEKGLSLEHADSGDIKRGTEGTVGELDELKERESGTSDRRDSCQDDLSFADMEFDSNGLQGYGHVECLDIEEDVTSTSVQPSQAIHVVVNSSQNETNPAIEHSSSDKKLHKLVLRKTKSFPAMNNSFDLNNSEKKQSVSLKSCKSDQIIHTSASDTNSDCKVSSENESKELVTVQSPDDKGHSTGSTTASSISNLNHVTHDRTECTGNVGHGEDCVIVPRTVELNSNCDNSFSGSTLSSDNESECEIISANYKDPESIFDEDKGSTHISETDDLFVSTLGESTTDDHHQAGSSNKDSFNDKCRINDGRESSPSESGYTSLDSNDSGRGSTTKDRSSNSNCHPDIVSEDVSWKSDSTVGVTSPENSPAVMVSKNRNRNSNGSEKSDSADSLGSKCHSNSSISTGSETSLDEYTNASKDNLLSCTKKTMNLTSSHGQLIANEMKTLNENTKQEMEVRMVQEKLKVEKE